jgi:hypothetical protein
MQLYLQVKKRLCSILIYTLSRYKHGAFNAARLNFGDAEALFAMRTDAEVMKYIDINIPKSVEAVHDWIKMIHETAPKKRRCFMGLKPAWQPLK